MTPVHTVDSLRKSRDINAADDVGLFYAAEVGAGDISSSVPGRTFLISYYVTTSTSTTTSTATATATATAVCSSTTTYSLCV